MTIDIRNRIEFLISSRFNIPAIAYQIGRSPSTVRNEILNHRIDSNKGYKRSNRLCAHFDACQITHFNGHGDRKWENQPGCFEPCLSFCEASCHRLSHPPFVCNGCDKEYSCPLMKKFYIASVAQKQYESERSLSRTGVHPNKETIEKMDAVISPCIKRGQSPMAVKKSNPELFDKYSKSTLYGWIANGLFSAKKYNLPFAGTRKKPHKKPLAKTDAKCRIGRTYQDMNDWLNAHEGQIVNCEFDTVLGAISGKILFTMAFPETGLSLAFLRDRRSSQTCTRIFNLLWDAAGQDLFLKLFKNSLTDNGPEFSDPVMIENYRPDPEHNPTKLTPRGIKVWFADPYCSSQKPHIERFHNELRRILPKGTSFDQLVQEQINLTISHLNSYPRETTEWKVPYDRFIEKYGEEGKHFLDTIGIERIPNNDVTLHPFLLGERYLKAAEKAILKKNGVLATQKKANN